MKIKRPPENISLLIRESEDIDQVIRQIRMHYDNTDYIVDEYTIADLRVSLENIQQNDTENTETDDLIDEYIPENKALNSIKQSVKTIDMKKTDNQFSISLCNAL